METSTLSGVRCAQSAARGHVLRRAAARRSFRVSDSSLRSLSPPLLAGQRLLNRQPSRIHPVQAAPSTPPPPGSAGDEADVLKLHEELLAQVGVEGYLNRKRVCRVDASESFTWPRRTKNSDLLLPLPLLSFLLFAYSLFSPFSLFRKISLTTCRSSSARSSSASSWRPSTRPRSPTVEGQSCAT